MLLLKMPKVLYLIKIFNHCNILAKGGEIAYIPQKGSRNYIALYKTNSFMNLSGPAVKSTIRFCEVF